MTAPNGLHSATETWLGRPSKTPGAAVPPAVASGLRTPAGGESRVEQGSANTPPAGVPHVIGLDPSLTGSGIASSHGWCETRGYVKAKAKDPGITQIPHGERLNAMVALTCEIVDLIGRPDLVVVEAPAFSRSNGGAHERAFLWWNLYRTLAGRDVPVAVMSIQQRLTYATGKGSGAKGAVIDAASRRWPMFATGGNDNLADAVVFCAAGMDWLGHPLAIVPASHRKALGSVAWPEFGGAL